MLPCPGLINLALLCSGSLLLCLAVWLLARWVPSSSIKNNEVETRGVIKPLPSFTMPREVSYMKVFSLFLIVVAPSLTVLLSSQITMLSAAGPPARCPCSWCPLSTHRCWWPACWPAWASSPWRGWAWGWPSPRPGGSPLWWVTAS